MVSYKAYSKKNAEAKAAKMRKMGYTATVYPRKERGVYGVSVTRGKK